MKTEKIIIVIITYNISSLIKLQVDCIKKFCKDDYSIVVVDNSTDLEIADQIKYHATQAGCTYFKTNASSSNGSASHAFAANLSYLKLKDFQGVFFYLDHDAFPVREFSGYEILGDRVIAGIGQAKGNKKYMFPGCLFFDNKKIERNMVDFSPVGEYGMDTGGGLYKIIDHYTDDACVFFNEAYEQNPNFTKSFYNFYSMINDKMFLHCINGSNWANSEGHQERINSMINIIKERVGL